MISICLTLGCKNERIKRPDRARHLPIRIKNSIPNVESYFPRCQKCHAGWLVEHVQETDVASANFECFGCRNTIYKGDAHYSGRRNSTWSARSSARELQDVRVCIECTHRYRQITENNE